MLPRTLEPEVMDTREEAVDYDSMDHSGVNRVFVDDLVYRQKFEGDYFRRRASQIKNVWIPYGA